MKKSEEIDVKQKIRIIRIYKESHANNFEYADTFGFKSTPLSRRTAGLVSCPRPEQALSKRGNCAHPGCLLIPYDLSAA
jgi:hypothetical protein